MKSTLYATREYFHKYGSRFVAFAMSVAIVTILSLALTRIASAQTYTSPSSTTNPSTSSGSSGSSSSSGSTNTSSASFTVQMGLGARSANVSALQSFLASDSAIYPQGLVTGYYGSLTQAAVKRFQARYGISTTGYVGPLTLAEIREIIAQGGMGSSGGTGGGTTSSDLTAPALFNVIVSTSTNSLTFSFNTDEVAASRVAYGTSPLAFSEGDINSRGFGPLGGLSVNNSFGTSTSHSITVSGLNPNTTYYFTIIATDQNGNASVWGPNNAIRTSP